MNGTDKQIRWNNQLSHGQLPLCWIKIYN